MTGKLLAKKLQEETKNKVNKFKNKPSLAVCLVGEHPASEIYVKNKQKACNDVGIHCDVHRILDSISENNLIGIIQDLNDYRKTSHGIIVQLPLPIHINQSRIINSLSPHKDVDCFHPHNLGLLFDGNPRFIPCTPHAIETILLDYEVELEGKHVCIINDSIVVGKPLALLLNKRRATITLCNAHTKNLKEICRQSDIIVSAVGKRPDFILNKDYIHRAKVIIDLGISHINGKVVGDADFEIYERVELITPVVGGIGPLTVQMLLRNTIKAFEYLENINNGNKIICDEFG